MGVDDHIARQDTQRNPQQHKNEQRRLDTAKRKPRKRSHKPEVWEMDGDTLKYFKAHRHDVRTPAFLRLSLADRARLLTLQHWTDNRGICELSIVDFAFVTHDDPAECQLTMKRLVAAKLLSMDEYGRLYFVNWRKTQGRPKTPTERKREQRKRDAEKRSMSRDVTTCHVFNSPSPSTSTSNSPLESEHNQERLTYRGRKDTYDLEGNDE